MFQLPFTLDSGRKTPLYQQLYDSLVSQIRAGALPAGTKLPGKRTLAAQLAVGVNTVDTAYQMLAAEGYLESRERSGFFVQEVSQPLAAPAPVSAGSMVPEPEAAERTPRFDLSTGAVDTALFPFRTWGRIQKELLYDAPELLLHGHRQGDRALREAIGEYLATYRGVVCDPEQLVVFPDGCVMEALAQAMRMAESRAGVPVRLSRFDETNLYLTGAALAVREYFTNRGGYIG